MVRMQKALRRRLRRPPFAWVHVICSKVLMQKLLQLIGQCLLRSVLL